MSRPRRPMAVARAEEPQTSRWRWAMHALVVVLVALAGWNLLASRGSLPPRSEPEVTVTHPLLRDLNTWADHANRFALGRMRELAPRAP